jgi:hypothetical protein
MRSPHCKIRGGLDFRSDEKLDICQWDIKLEGDSR